MPGTGEVSSSIPGTTKNTQKRNFRKQARKLTSVIIALGKLREENYFVFKTSQGLSETLPQKIKRKNVHKTPQKSRRVFCWWNSGTCKVPRQQRLEALGGSR